MKIYSFDPGKRHYAWAVSDDGHVLETGYIKPTIVDVTKDVVLADTVEAFCRQFDRIFSKYPPTDNDWMLIERYTKRLRGDGRGNVSELTNFMIGASIVAAMRSWKIRNVELVMASTWKTWYRRTYNVEEPGPAIIEYVGADKITIHEADAVGLGCWMWERKFGRDGVVKTCLRDLKQKL